MGSKRKSYKLKFKRRVIILCEQMENISEVTRFENVSRPTVSKWMKNKTKIMNTSSNQINMNSRRIKNLTSQAIRLNYYNPEAGVGSLHGLFLKEKKNGVSGLSILNKMLKDQEENQTNKHVKVNLSWLQRFMSKHQLSLRRISGSGRSFPSNSKVIIQNL